MKRFVVSAALAAVLLTPVVAQADQVLKWNEIAASLPGANPFEQARRLAIAQLAVFEAVNAIVGEYEPYLGTISAAPGASADAAAVAAAHRVLITLYPASATLLDARKASSLAEIPDGMAKTDGIATGEAAAAAMLAARAADGALPPASYIPSSSDPGQWQLTTGCAAGVLYHWQNVTLFGLPNKQDFMAAPPPALGSSQYAKDYGEVQDVGGTLSSTRPFDREEVVRFYGFSSPGYLFSSVARQLAGAQGRSLSHSARALALIMMATSDSLVVSFASKYEYKLWRPETAIRTGSGDGNDKTDGEAGFTTFFSTPCFPSYPSNHASGSNGAAEAIRRIYGAAAHGPEITMTNPAVPAIAHITLTYRTLSELCEDIDDARVYGGIHFRFDQDGGTRLGRNAAAYIVKNWLRPLHGN